ncbi:MAG: ribbon-helix-helix domain-containing protein [Candidatus Sigynarchaeota archaeon]
METLQIRLPKELLEKVDQLVKSGLYRNRSEILRIALQEYISRSSYNGSLPFIVGPFNQEDISSLLDLPLDALKPDERDVKALQEKVKDFKVPRT